MVANIHPESGIAYGYIAANSLDSETVQELMFGSQATDETFEECLREAREEYESRCEESGIESPKPFDETAEYQDFCDAYEPCEPEISGELDGVRYRTSWLGGALNFFVLYSPHITNKAGKASPCVPNAGILDSDGDVIAYDVPADWRYRE